MARVFISYSRQDESFARRLAEALSDMGADVWIDIEDIPAGMKWSSAIQQGLDEGELLIVLISPDSMASRNVEDEWQYYIDHAKPVVPVLLEPARIHFQLNRLQYIDFHVQPFDIAINKLYAELRRKGLSLTPPVPPSETASLPDFDSLSPEEIDQVLAELQKRRQQFDTSAAVPYPPSPPVSGSGSRRTWLIAGGAGIVLLLLIGLGVTFSNLFGRSGTATPGAQTQVVQDESPTATDPIPTATTQAATATPTVPPTLTPTEVAAGFDSNHPILKNADWSPVRRTLNGMEMVLVPTGRFMMGTSSSAIEALYADCELYIANCRGSRLFSDEGPPVDVRFNRPFWIGRFEVTNGQFGSAGNFAGNNIPRTNVTWDQAENFCQQQGLRLPSEAEWEYASRGPDSLAYPWGDSFTDAVFNYCDRSCNLNVSWRDTAHNDGYAEPAPVGSLPQSVSWVGAHDMAGNVWEWTSTIYASSPGGSSEVAGNTTARRTLKGSSWNWILHEGRGAARAPHAENNPASPWYGFRCAKDFDPSELS